jgi:hypothetical protein
VNAKAERLCLWLGIIFPVVMLISILAGDFLPPPSPADSAQQVAEMYRSNSVGIRISGLLLGLAGTLTMPLAAVLTVRMRRIEGSASVLAWTQLASATCGAVLFIVPAFFWEAAAYRADIHSDEIFQTLNDLAWLPLISAVFPAQLQLVSIGLAILMDRSAEPELPRWLGYLSLWVAVLLTPSALVLFFKSGPFAWNGVLTWWLAAIAFVAWFYTICFVLLKSVEGRKGSPPLSDELVSK